ncbi:MAG: efflux RND transporter periplasmic adaptor subunit [Caldimonas sp.]|uniref:efflux RND transporter periplasmic adaptor subunit n=1 Tax=Caldimonas sp. TaxID=2838790 RepID=UPI00391940AA
MKKLHALVAVVGIALASAAAYWYQHGGSGSKTGTLAAEAGSPAPAPARGAGPSGPVAVEVGLAQSVQVAEQAQAVGTLKSRQGVMLRPEVSGRVAALGFRDGQPVRRGQLLVQLDDSVVRAQVQQAEAQLSIARANDARNRELLAQNFISQAAVDQGAANLQVAQAQLALVRAQLDRLRIVAPFDGTVGIRLVNVGDYVREGADLVSLEDLRALHVDFRLPERYLPQLRVGQAAQVGVDALPGQRFEARVRALEPQVDVNGRSVLVRAAIDNPKGLLRPGMFARVDAVLSTRVDAVMVPEEAVVLQGGRQYVILVVEGGEGMPAGTRVSRRVEVVLGQRREGRVEVVQGVPAGATVVTAGHQRIARDGTPLRVIELEGAARPADAASASAAPGAASDASRPGRRALAAG